VRRVGILLSREEGWDPIIKRGGLGSYYQEGRVGILLSSEKGWDPIIKREGWDPIIKRGGLGSFWILLSRGECGILLIKEGRVGILLSRGRVGILLIGLSTPHLCACLKPVPGFLASHIVVFL
jgi:hypothetical protein